MKQLAWNGRLAGEIVSRPTIERAQVDEVFDRPKVPAKRKAPERVLAVFRFKGEARGFHHYDVLRGGWIESISMEIDTGGTFAVGKKIESPPLDIADASAAPKKLE